MLLAQIDCLRSQLKLHVHCSVLSLTSIKREALSISRSFMATSSAENTEECSGRKKERVFLPHTNAQPTPSSVLEPSVKVRVEPWYRDKCSMARNLNSYGRRSAFLTSDREMSTYRSMLFHGGGTIVSTRLTPRKDRLAFAPRSLIRMQNGTAQCAESLNSESRSGENA